MTTAKKLWLGFGTLTALLVLVVVVLVLNLRSIQGRMNEMTRARDRSAATRELEINVLDYAVGALLHLDTGDPKALQATAKDAADVEKNLADYKSLATTDRPERTRPVTILTSSAQKRCFSRLHDYLTKPPP